MSPSTVTVMRATGNESDRFADVLIDGQHA